MKTVALGKVAKIDRTVANDNECLSLPYVGLEHVEKERGHFADGFVPTPLNMLATNFRFTPKHVLYGKLRPYLNKVVLPSFDGVCTTEILPILPNEEKLDRTFLWAILLSPTFVNWATSQISGANLPRLDPKLLAEYEIPLPPLTEQKRIASLLARVDRLRQLRRTAHDLGDALLQSVFLEMFGDPVTNSKKWDVESLEDVLASSPQNGLYVPEEQYESRDSENGVEMVHMSDAFYGRVERGSLKRVKISEKDIQKYSITHHDLLIARRSLNFEGAAKPCLIPISEEPLVFESSMIRVTTDQSKILPIYLYYYFSNEKAKQAHILKYVTKSTISGINQENLKQIKIIMPPLSLQEEFAGVVARVESLRGRMGESTRQVEGLFDALLAQTMDGGR